MQIDVIDDPLNAGAKKTVITSPDPAVDPPLSTTSSVYDGAGRVTQSVNADGHVTNFVYAAAGRQVEVSDVVAGIARTTTFLYDDAGRQIETTDALGRATKTEYDEAGNVVKTIFPDGTFSSSTYDYRGRLITETDAMGITKSFEYDKDGRLTAVILPAVPDPEDLDGSGNPIVKNPRYEYEYDIYGNRTLIRDPKGRETAFAYDEFGRQLTRTLPDGLVEEFRYDDKGRQEVHIDFEGRVLENVFDDTPAAGGRLAEKRFFDNLTAYDNGNGTATETTLYSYDAEGRLSQLDQRAGGVSLRVVAYTYDDEGRLTQLDSPEGILNYEYDPATGRRTRTFTTDELDEVLNDFRYTYDELGRLETVTVHKRNAVPLAQTETTSYEYDPVGNLDKVFLPNGIISDYEYDDLNRLDTLTHYEPDATPGDLSDNPKVAEFDYTVRADGKRTGVSETYWEAGVPQTIDVAWTYDNLGRLVDEVFDHYDDLLDFSASYEYDLVGNRLEKSNDKSSDGSVDETISYSYDNNDRLLTESTDTDNNGSVDTTTTYGYTGTTQTGKTVTDNAAGQVTSQTTYSYDLQGRMSVVVIDTLAAGVVTQRERTTFDYDDSGIRVSAKHEVDSDGNGTYDSETTTSYLNDKNNHTGYSQVLEEVTRDSLGNVVKTRVYTLGHDIIAQTTFESGGPAEGTTVVLLYDGHGSTRFLADPTAAITAVYAYDAYGNAIGFDPATAATSFLYSGEQFDARILQQYLRARYYAAETGRFNRLDPFAGNFTDPQSLHKYLYTHGDPVNGIDPSGKFIGAIGGFLGGFATSLRLRTGHAYKVLGVAVHVTIRLKILITIFSTVLGALIENKLTVPQLSVVRQSGTSRTIFRATTNDVNQILQDAVNANDPIHEFTFLGHGSQELIQLAPGQSHITTGNNNTILMGDGNQVIDITQLFNNALDPNANVYLTGSNTAAGNPPHLASRLSLALPGRTIHGTTSAGLYVGFFSAIAPTRSYRNGVEV